MPSQSAGTSATTAVRNSFRRFFNSKIPQRFWKEMQAVRQLSPPNAYSEICKIVELNPAYPFSGLGNTFPDKRDQVPWNEFQWLEALPLERELALQVSRINHHKNRINESLISLSEINKLIRVPNYQAAEAAIQNHKSNFGLSFVVMKKELQVAVYQGGLTALSATFRKLTNGAPGTAWSLLCRYVYDQLDPTNNANRAIRLWLNMAESRMERSEWYFRAIRDDLLTATESEKSLSSALLRYSCLSLTDLTLLIWRKQQIHGENRILSNGFARLNPETVEILRARFSKTEVEINDAYAFGEDDVQDIDIYRSTLAFNDISNISIWRAHVSRIAFSDRLNPEFLPKTDTYDGLIRASARLLSHPSEAESILNELKAWETSVIIKPEAVHSQGFLKAVLVGEGLRSVSIGSTFSPSALVDLIASTVDSHLYVSRQTLDEILKLTETKAYPLLAFSIRDLIYKKDRSQDNELERRLSFMDIFAEADTLDIVQYIIGVSEWSFSTARDLANTCTRSFLERLYLLMESLKDVIETRLRLCDWLASNGDLPSESLIEERDALEREFANLDARSDLDSTRVHVDEEGLREWFAATQMSNVKQYAQTVLSEDPNAEVGSLLTFTANREHHPPAADENEFAGNTQIGSGFLLVNIVDETLRAFATDRTFGLDAYLSRRIRHGTLSGQVMTPLKRILNRLTELREAHELVHGTSPLSGLMSLVDEWRKFLTSELDRVRMDLIQIRTPDHPSGLIDATWRTGANITHLDALIARARSRVLAAGGAYDIFADVYSLCWDCLERDLAQLRLYMAREFYPRAIARLGELTAELSGEERQLGLPLIVQLRDTLENRVQDVCGWFIRPVFRRDRYNLKMLVTSTTSVVRELDDRYKFVEEIRISDEISLSRGGFDVFSDALFVLIGNAAKHGKHNGRIRVSADLVDGREEVIMMEIISHVENDVDFENAVDRIRSALSQDGGAAIEQAAVGEGFSGLRKLVGLLGRVKSEEAFLAFAPSLENLQIAFWITVPAEIISSRGAV